MGCGVACVAFLTQRRGESTRAAYERAKSAFAKPERALTTGFLPPMMLDALGSLGVPGTLHEPTGIEPPEHLPTRTVVLVKRYRGDAELHYVVKAHDGFVDPMDRVVEKKDREKKKADEWSPQKRGLVHTWPAGWQLRRYITTKT